jgi:signal transduction histidine kinase
LINQLELLNHKLAYCESNFRAYVLSGEKDFQYKYEDSRKVINQYKKHLDSLPQEYLEQKEIVYTLKSLLDERINLMQEGIDIFEGRIPDKKGIKKRYARAQHLNNRIEATAEQLVTVLVEKLQQKREEEQELFKSNKLANQAAIFLSLILAVMIGLVVRKDLKEKEKSEEQLRILNNQKSQFFSIISHDLRGPTRNTVLLLEMIGNPVYDSSPEESAKMGGMALESARQTQKLVEDLLAWGRLQMDEVGIRTGPLQPFILCEKVCKALQPTATLKNITLENMVPRSLWVQADNNMVEAIIRNLISNAIKFTPESGKVQLRANKCGEFVEVSVEDSGVGISQDAIKKIFDFHTKHSTRGTAGETGSGLGLAVCREFVERNGGSIDVESKPGKGSKFNVRLPVAVLTEQEA